MKNLKEKELGIILAIIFSVLFQLGVLQKFLFFPSLWRSYMLSFLLQAVPIILFCYGKSRQFKFHLLKTFKISIQAFLFFVFISLLMLGLHAEIYTAEIIFTYIASKLPVLVGSSLILFIGFLTKAVFIALFSYALSMRKYN